MRLPDTRPDPTATIWFENRAISARSGETVASALSAADIVAFRRLDGAGRGLHCGMGACFDCIVTIDGVPSQRACMTPARDGMHIGAATHTPLPPMLPEQVLTPQILVVGAGPAGLSAAIAAHESGAATLLLDERTIPGGQYYKHAATADARSRAGDRLRTRAAAIPTLQAAVWGAFPDGPELAALAGEARLILRPRQLILAPGAHEAPTPLPGWTLPGCMTTGALQGLIRTHRVAPGASIVIAGNGPLNLQVAVELLRAGGHVAAVVEAAPRPSGAPLALISPARAWDGWRMLDTLHRAKVPVLWETQVTAVLGTDRVTAVALRGPRGDAVIPADAIALNTGFQAETGLARSLGAAHTVRNARLETITDAEGRTTQDRIFAVGDGARMGGAAVALLRGRAAGLAAARALGHPTPRPPRAALRRAERFQHAIWQAFAAPPPNPASLPDETIICRCEAITAGTLRRAITDGSGSLPMLKRATRAGMGHCAGRFCGATVARLAGRALDESAFAAPRMPLRPVQAGLIMADHGEPQDAMIPAPLPTSWTTTPPAPHPADAEIVVIGAGIVGLATALYLARDGRDVLLIDRNEPGLAASTANAGSLHIQLVPYVYAAGDGGPMADSLPLGPASVALWRDIARDANEDLGLRTEGGLVLAETEPEMTLLTAKAAFERSRGIPSEVIGPEELNRIAPHLAGNGVFAGASFCASEGQGDPLRGTLALLALARRAGVRIATGLDVQALQAAKSGWHITLPTGQLHAAQVVNSAGVQAGRVAAMTGVTLPVHALVQQVIATEPVPAILRQLVAWTGRHLSLKQAESGHLLIGGGWPGTQDSRGAAQLRRESIEGNLALAGRALPALRGLHVLRAWTGLAPTLNRAPIISATPSQPGLFHGVTGNGYTLGPVLGRMLADAVRGCPLPPAFSL